MEKTKKIVSMSISMSKALLQDGSFKCKKRENETLGILCNEECSEKFKLQELGWNSMKEKAKAWIGLDTFETADRGNSPEICFLFSNCKLKLHNPVALEQTKKRKENKNQKGECESFAKKKYYK